MARPKKVVTEEVKEVLSEGSNETGNKGIPEEIAEPIQGENVETPEVVGEIKGEEPIAMLKEPAPVPVPEPIAEPVKVETNKTFNLVLGGKTYTAKERDVYGLFYEYVQGLNANQTATARKIKLSHVLGLEKYSDIDELWELIKSERPR